MLLIITVENRACLFCKFKMFYLRMQIVEINTVANIIKSPSSILKVYFNSVSIVYLLKYVQSFTRRVNNTLKTRVIFSGQSPF